MIMEARKEDKMRTAKDDMVNEGGATAATLMREAEDFGSSMKDELKEAAQRTGKQARKLIDEAGDDIVKASKSLMEIARENPVRMGILAVAAGLIFTQIFRTRTNH